ncbi:hypothetical protein M9H77_18791 [Catharanthus roseus]|uniref:Uncharacterized protein n=1 Tax=Catharanthus roseus TaxID=4058 RepID=A0ACC0B8M0_CATRO|nr:hypothetical protein M9H77_18791 [Catharanthus roseus]
MARRIEKEHREKLDYKRFETILWSSVQVEESKEANLESLGASKTKRMIFLDHTVDGESWEDYNMWYQSEDLFESGTNFTPRRQDGVGYFSPCARSFEIEVENGIAYRPFERLPEKETRN